MENFDDVMAALNFSIGAKRLTAVSEGGDGTESLDEDSLVVYRFLEKGEANLEEMCMATGMDVGRMLAALMKLELKLMVDHDARQYYHLTLKRTGLSTEP
jgi:predicted Rossmann fold nucleotide-binding protein DprA/Smf involved in DNA uptake